MVGGGRGGAGLVDGVGGGGAYRLVQPVGQAEHPAAVRLFRFSHLLPVCHTHQISGASVRFKKNLVPIKRYLYVFSWKLTFSIIAELN